MSNNITLDAAKTRGTGSFATLFRVALKNSTSLSSVPAAVTTLVIIPLIEILLLVFASIGVTGEADARVVYSSVIVAFGTSVLLGVVEEITRDRNLEVLQPVLLSGSFQVRYWLSKVFVPLLSSFVVATVSIVGVTLLWGGSTLELFWGALALLPAVCVSGAVIGVCAALLTLGGNNPYLISNFLAAALTLATGVILPISQYPIVFEVLGRVLPFTWLIAGYRSGGSAGNEALIGFAGELVVLAAWVLVTALLSRWVIRRWRSGKVHGLLW